VCLLLVAALGSGCSVRRYALNRLGDALAQSGTTFASDEDPDLIQEAAPFSLKLMESVLAESPRHAPLLTAAASGFTQYAYAFVQQEAERREAQDLAAATELRGRAKRLYLRARGYALRGCETRHPGFQAALRKDAAAALRPCTRADVPLLYWAAASWGAAMTLSKDSPEFVADQPLVEALIDRAAALDPDFGEGAVHTFLVTYELARPSAKGDPIERAKLHFNRAVELSHGQQAAPLVAWAESVSVKRQDAAEFKALLERALAIDPAARPEMRLANVVMQRRAKWLLSRMDDLILPPPPADDTK
jgi:predicted anti-sigma-YlaC factor YlaD